MYNLKTNKRKLTDKKQPNIIFIFADQLGAEWTECYGNKDVNTPNLVDIYNLVERIMLY